MLSDCVQTSLHLCCHEWCCLALTSDRVTLCQTAHLQSQCDELQAALSAKAEQVAAREQAMRKEFSSTNSDLQVRLP